MGLELQVRGVTSAMPTNCAAAVTMAAGALQPACGCLISRILHQCTALCERCLSLPKPGNCEVSNTDARRCNLKCCWCLRHNSCRYAGVSPAPLHCILRASQQQLHQSTIH